MFADCAWLDVSTQISMRAMIFSLGWFPLLCVPVENDGLDQVGIDPEVTFSGLK